MGICCQKDNNQQIPKPKKQKFKCAIDVQSIKKHEEIKQEQSKELHKQQLDQMSKKSLSIEKSPLFQKRKEFTSFQKSQTVYNLQENGQSKQSKTERRQRRRRKTIKGVNKQEISNESTAVHNTP